MTLFVLNRIVVSSVGKSRSNINRTSIDYLNIKVALIFITINLFEIFYIFYVKSKLFTTQSGYSHIGGLERINVGIEKGMGGGK